MRTFDEIRAIAIERHGEDTFRARLAFPRPRDEVAATPEDRWLATFARAVFQAGFSWKVIEAKWDGFEAAFDGFDVDRCAMMGDDRLDALLADKTIVRNGAKILSVRDNAVFLQELRAEGGAGPVFANWPATDHIGLLDLLKTRGSRLGGTTAQYALRSAGVDGFVLSRDVVARLVAEGVIDRAPTSKTAMASVQDAFNRWSVESHRSLTEISRTLALSI